VTCRVLGFSKQAFYQWRAAPVSARDWNDAHLINAVVDVHHDDPEFGYGSSPMDSPAWVWSRAATG
jgi:putative transposase